MTKSEKETICKILDDLDLELRERFVNSQKIDPSFATGHLGVAMFYAYYFMMTKDKRHHDYANSLINRCIDYYAESETTFTFCDGAAGMGWVFQHLANMNILVNTEEDPLIEYDDFLLKMAHHQILAGNYDYLHGGLGIGIYFLDRKLNKQPLSSLLIDLERIAQNDSHGVFWEDLMSGRYQEVPGRLVNFGLAHGMPSITFFLAKLLELGIESAKTTLLLRESINYVLYHSKTDNYVGSFFPLNHLIEVDGGQKQMSRLAWCYGDLGVFVSLIQAARSLKDKSLEEMLVSMALRSTKRLRPEETLIKDAGICHGCGGVAHLYARLHEMTGKEEFKATSIYWLRQLIDSIDKMGGIKNFKEYLPKENSFVESHGFLTGSTGIGLVLISFLNPKISPDWDRFLLNR